MRWILRIVGFPLRLVVIAFTLVFFGALMLIGARMTREDFEGLPRSVWRFAMGQQDWL